jgi:hypothetical protein
MTETFDMTKNTISDSDEDAGASIHPIGIAAVAAAGKKAAASPMQANAIELIHAKFGFDLPAAQANDAADLIRLKALIAAHRASAAAILDSSLFTPAMIAAAAKLRSAPGVHRYMKSVRWAAGTAVRKADVTPRDALTRALMFPIVYATSDAFIGEGFFDMTMEGDESDEVYGGIIARGMAKAGHSVTAAEVTANLDAVRSTFYALLHAEEGTLPLHDDPELEPGDQIDIEVDLLADGAFLDI